MHDVLFYLSIGEWGLAWASTGPIWDTLGAAIIGSLPAYGIIRLIAWGVMRPFRKA